MNAILSDCGLYRYTLTREIDTPDHLVLGPLLFIMLNPSKADATIDDNTIKSCMRFARRECADVMTVVNLFGLRSTDPKFLYGHPDPIGPDNDNHVASEIMRHDKSRIIAAWGREKIAQEKGALLRAAYGPFMCLGQNQDGSPHHPLYLPTITPLHEIYSISDERFLRAHT